MIFAAPWAFYFLLMTAAVVALYILKVKRRRENVPSLAFWMRLVRETRTTSLFRKLKRLLWESPFINLRPKVSAVWFWVMGHTCVFTPGRSITMLPWISLPIVKRSIWKQLQRR